MKTLTIFLGDELKQEPYPLDGIKTFEIIQSVRSALRQNLPAPAGTFSCSRARCYMCSFFNSATSISGPKSNFVILQNFTRTSSNDIIYCISCS